MGLRVTLVLADFPHFDDDYGGAFAHGVASLAATLKTTGHGVQLLHFVRPPSRGEFEARLLPTTPDLVGFSSITPFFPFVREWIGWTRSVTQAPIVVGGVHAILSPEDVMSVPEVDVVCTGEGEYTLLELCRRVEQGGDLSEVQGTWGRWSNDRVRKNPPRPLVEDLDRLPLPDYSIFDYPKLYAARHQRLSVMVSRGCPYQCSYCANASLRSAYPNPGHYVRFLSPPRAIELLSGLLDRYPGTTRLVFNDNILCRDVEWLEEFSRLYHDEIGLPFLANMRPGLAVAQAPRLLKHAGCRQVCLGVECGNEEIANTVLRRALSNEVIEESFRAYHAAGIETVAYNMVGVPLETMDTMLETVRLNARLRPSMVTASIYYPLPGTESRRLCQEKGFLTDRHGLHYGDLVMLHQPTVREEDVLFMHRFFRRLVHLYLWAGALPGPAGRAATRALDHTLKSPLLPRRTLVTLKAAHHRWRRRRIGPVRAGAPATSEAGGEG